MQFETIIVAQVRRLKHPDGHTKFVEFPFDSLELEGDKAVGAQKEVQSAEVEENR
jgi:hypothetical protein